MPSDVYLFIFEHVLSVASCYTTLNMESIDLVIFEHILSSVETSAGVSDYIPMILNGQVNRLLA